MNFSAFHIFNGDPTTDGEIIYDDIESHRIWSALQILNLNDLINFDENEQYYFTISNHNEIIKLLKSNLNYLRIITINNKSVTYNMVINQTELINKRVGWCDTLPNEPTSISLFMVQLNSDKNNNLEPELQFSKSPIYIPLFFEWNKVENQAFDDSD